MSNHDHWDRTREVGCCTISEAGGECNCLEDTWERGVKDSIALVEDQLRRARLFTHDEDAPIRVHPHGPAWLNDTIDRLKDMLANGKPIETTSVMDGDDKCPTSES